MEQKQTLWILAAAGVFLCVVIGAALILYQPLTKAPDISNVSNQNSQVYTNPSSTTIADPASQGMSATAPDGTLQGAAAEGTIDLGNLAFDNTQNSLNASTPAPVVGNANENVVTKPTTTVVTTNSSPAASEVVIATPKQNAASTNTGTNSANTSKASTSTSTKTESVTEYWVQAGSFSGRSYAENAQDIISSYKIESEIFTKEVNGKTMYRVRIGPYRTHTEADYWMTVIQSDPLFKDAYITEVKTKK